ncbi:pectinesterase family protein [Pedobacter sp. ASV28]|uniref:pectinesterase family protein n=1 Tax=Pedobacter sp. ASV28 TaxID=2795123 RepID=UPI0018EBC165|nr:pectinesterase family protein [Pedobacter sp. ASV28]
MTKTITSCLSGLILVFLCCSVLAVQPNRITVAKDGSGNYETVAAAIASVPENNSRLITIYIKNGIYKEKLVIGKSKTNIALVGQDVAKTIITYDDYASKKDSSGKEIGTFGSPSVSILCDNFKAVNITFENASGPVGQAVALAVSGDRVYFRNCRFLGSQDTVYTFGNTSRQYFYRCYIEGTVDFIFGAAVAVFEQCEIFCKRGGYITAASTPEGQQYGYVFLNSKIMGIAPENSVHLGRPWRPYAKTVFIRTEMPALVKKVGWHNWGKTSNEQTAFYAEYENKGEGFKPLERVPWAKQLTATEAKLYTIENIFKDWNPKK